ncbi:MAG TPA: hypothetical protein VGO73_14190, partial [Pyrinomonadaceae bacterium]|nr:hypothetical protein [Pyrinomonadaceae bacterium]
SESCGLSSFGVTVGVGDGAGNSEAATRLDRDFSETAGAWDWANILLGTAEPTANKAASAGTSNRFLNARLDIFSLTV